MMSNRDTVTLDGYVVRNVTEKAVRVVKAGGGQGVDEAWIPKSLIQDGDTLLIGDTDIVLPLWKAGELNLDY